MGSAAEIKNNPPDLINVALELVVKVSLELPGYSTLDEMVSQIRHEVNTAIFERVAGGYAAARPPPGGIAGDVRPDQEKPVQPPEAGGASWSACREQVEHLRWVDALGDTGAWLAGMAAAYARLRRARQAGQIILTMD